MRTSSICCSARWLLTSATVAVEWGNGTRLPIQGVYLAHGTLPAGSTWAMMPLPYSDNHTAAQFDAPVRPLRDV